VDNSPVLHAKHAKLTTLFKKTKIEKMCQNPITTKHTKKVELKTPQIGAFFLKQNN